MRQAGLNRLRVRQLGAADDAPSDATFWLQTADTDLPNAQAIGALSDGLIKHASGVAAQAVPGTDYIDPAGVSGGQTWIGGTDSGDDATIQSTSHATRGSVLVGNTGSGAVLSVDEANIQATLLTGGQILLPTGSGAVPPIGLTGDSTIGFFFTTTFNGQFIFTGNTGTSDNVFEAYRNVGGGVKRFAVPGTSSGSQILTSNGSASGMMATTNSGTTNRLEIGTTTTHDVALLSDNTARALLTSDGDFELAGLGGLATTAVAGFPSVPSCAGTPTGVATPNSNMVPLVYDRTNDLIYAYNGGWVAAAASGVGGSIADTQVAFGSGTNIAGSANLTWDGNTLLVTDESTPGTPLQLHGPTGGSETIIQFSDDDTADLASILVAGNYNEGNPDTGGDFVFAVKGTQLIQVGIDTGSAQFLVPLADDTMTLGTASLQWSDVRSVLINGADFHLGGDGAPGDWWLREGADGIFGYNARTGKAHRLLLEEVPLDQYPDAPKSIARGGRAATMVPSAIGGLLQ